MRACWTFAIASLLVGAAHAGQGTAPVLIKNVRVVTAPGKVIESADILLKNGTIARIGSGIEAPAGAEIVDGAGLTAYPGFVHPLLRASVEGIVPSTQGLTPAQLMAQRDKDPFGVGSSLLSAVRTGSLVQADVFGSFARSGFGAAQVMASGGIIGTRGDVLSLASPDLSPKSLLASRDNVLVTLASSRGFGGGYPGSQMGVIAFARQALYDAQRYHRLKSAWEAGKSKFRPERDPALEALEPVVQGSAQPFFDSLTEVTAFQAFSLAKEFGLKPVYAFNREAGWVADYAKGATVLLRGSLPSKPALSASDEQSSLAGVRAYFNELQAPVELESRGIEFIFAPASADSTLSTLQTYVRAGLSKEAALASVTTRPAKLLDVSKLAGTLEEGKLGNLILAQGDLFDSSSQLMAVYIEGKKVTGAMPPLKKAEELKADEPLKLMKPNYQPFPRPAESAPAHRLYKNATIWTMGPQGVLADADILIKDGRVVAVGKGLKAPAGAEVIDAKGKHISPGLWDCHSHTAINGSVNEGSNMVTVECRIEDVVDHRSASIYRQLGGGTVGGQQLHGSANVIGGQSNPAKWRWGQIPGEFRVQGAPGGVKFALGQNPIREDQGGFGQGQPQPEGTHLLTWRPRTRMGNEESIRRALYLGLEYGKRWEAFRAGKTEVEPRRDLQLEGLWEIATGQRFIHSHGYRADELLMLLRVAKDVGAKIRTLQHVLEGYKIADEMAEQGVAGSTFSDWWGYKLEAYDAVPHNASLMADRGVSVSVNSDSDNHARRMNVEAAKAIRYGGASPERALSFVTIEPARQMGIDKWTGSLEVGKDADLVVWTSDPTSIFAVCLETYVDGIKRFDLADDGRQRQERLAELAEARKVLNEPAAGSEGQRDPGAEGPRELGAGEPKTERKASIAGIPTLTGVPGSAKYPRKPLLITGAAVHPMLGEPFVGDVFIGADGMIVAAGKVHSAPGVEKIDGKGKHLYPGMVDAATTLGLTEIGQVPVSDDTSERGDFHPDYRAVRAVNPDSELIAAARNQGILTALTAPSGSGLAGQAALLSLEGYTWEDMAYEGGLAIRVRLGGGGGRFEEGHNCDDLDDHEMRGGQGRRGQGEEAPPTSAVLNRISGELQKAREHAANVVEPKLRDDRYETLLKAADGKLPFLIEANSAADIKAAVAWAEKEKIAIQLTGCSSAGEIAAWLAEKQVPIILTATMNMPGTEDPLDKFYALAAQLQKAGVKFCLASGQGHNVRQIREYAGFSARHGLSAEDAARSVTLWPAEILGMGKRLGAIAPGCEGTIILTDGPLVETRTQVLRAWIRGRECDLSFRQTRLYDKYRTRPMPKRS